MLVNIQEHLHQGQITNKSYKGTVIDNDDPLKLGRVRVVIEGMLEGNKNNLPWISQRSATMMGGQPDRGSFFVPAVDSELEITFPTGDVYAGFYVGYWQTPNTHNPVFDDSYPDKYGFTDAGFTVSYDSNKQEFTIEHPEGSKIVMGPDGSVSIETDSRVKVVGKGGTEIGDSSSITQIKGSKVIMADGGPPFARHGDQVVGVTPTGDAGLQSLQNGVVIASSKKCFGG